MNNWTEVSRFPIEINLEKLHSFLLYKEIEHQIFEREGQQVLVIADESRIHEARHYISEDALKQIDSLAEIPSKPVERGSSISLPPLTLVILLLSWIGYAMVALNLEMQYLFSFNQYGLVANYLMPEFIVYKEPWRVFTPVFLHFSFTHIFANSMWFYIFAEKIERYTGPWKLLGLVIFTGIIGNLFQFVMHPMINFGGISGINFGLVGFLMIRQWLYPHPGLRLPPVLFGLLILSLIVGLLGWLDISEQLRVANGAHLGGLVAGILAGLIGAVLYQLGLRTRRL